MTEAERADLIDSIMDAELPRFAGALERLGEWPAEIRAEDEAGCE